MAELSYEQFLNNYQQYAPRTPIRRFKLKDGDSAIVRFNIKNATELSTYKIHKVNVNGESKTVLCLGNKHCPLCALDYDPRVRIYLELIQYVPNEDGSVELVPLVWERGYNYKTDLLAFEKEYGDLSSNLFKITRNGAEGDPNTTYSVILANTKFYVEELYPEDFSAFDNFSLENFIRLTTLTPEELETLKEKQGE